VIVGNRTSSFSRAAFRPAVGTVWVAMKSTGDPRANFGSLKRGEPKEYPFSGLRSFHLNGQLVSCKGRGETYNCSIPK
jgi:hypothetical protein